MDKNFIGKVAVVVFAVLISIGGIFGIRSVINSRAEAQRIKVHNESQAIIREMVKLGDFARIAPEEQEGIDKAADDIEAARYAIMHIIDNRIVFWGTEKQKADDWYAQLMRIKDENPYGWTYENIQLFNNKKNQAITDFEEAKRAVAGWITRKELVKNYKPGEKKLDRSNNT